MRASTLLPAIATVLTACVVVGASSSSASSSSGSGDADALSARLYLYPAAPAVTTDKRGASGARDHAAVVSARQLNSVLAHHFDVPGETLGIAAADREAWAWLPSEVYSGRGAAEQLFGAAKQRTAVLLSGLSSSEANEVMPSTIRNTHTVASAPHVSSFEALLLSYGDRLSDVAPTSKDLFKGFVADAGQGINSALEGAADWLAQHTGAQLGNKKTLDVTDIADEISAPFYTGLRTLVEYFDSIGSADAEAPAVANAPFNALRFDGLASIKEAYGEESAQYMQAKEALRSALSAAASKVALLQKDRKAHHIAFLIMPENGGAALSKRSDPLWPFRSSLATTPFLKSRAIGEDGEEMLAPRQGALVGHFDADPLSTAGEPAAAAPSEAPKERDYVGKCFSSESDLNKATANCSSHGKPKQSSKGGRKCYRCQCKPTKDDKGKVTEWAGEACQKQDISKEFVLLGSSAIALILVTIGSVLYLYYEGEQELPSVLAGISVPNK